MKLVSVHTLVLWLLVCASAFAVSYSNHQSRQQFIHWQKLLGDQRNNDVEWGRLLIEKSSLTSYTRLERLAAEKLKMAVPEAEHIRLINGVEL